MNVETTLKADAQFAEASKPGMRALDHPAMPPEPLLVLYASTGDTCRNATLSQVTPAASKVITLVRVQFTRVVAALAIQARHCRNCIERRHLCNHIFFASTAFICSPHDYPSTEY